MLGNAGALAIHNTKLTINATASTQESELITIIVAEHKDPVWPSQPYFIYIIIKAAMYFFV